MRIWPNWEHWIGWRGGKKNPSHSEEATLTVGARRWVGIVKSLRIGQGALSCSATAHPWQPAQSRQGCAQQTLFGCPVEAAKMQFRHQSGPSESLHGIQLANRMSHHFWEQQSALLLESRGTSHQTRSPVPRQKGPSIQPSLDEEPKSHMPTLISLKSSTAPDAS